MDFIIECSLATRTNLRNRIARWQSIVLMKCTNDHCAFVVSITMQFIYWDVQCRRRSTPPSPPTQPHRRRSQIECKWRHNKKLFFVLMLSTSPPLRVPSASLATFFFFFVCPFASNHSDYKRQLCVCDLNNCLWACVCHEIYIHQIMRRNEVFKEICFCSAFSIFCVSSSFAHSFVCWKSLFCQFVYRTC